MKIREVIVESISPAQSWIDSVYSRYPEWPYGQADRVMVWGSGEEQTFAAFKLKPGADARTVEIDWIMAGPEQRQGVGSRAIRELQRQAQESNIRLTLYPWSHGRISSASLTRLYKRHGFKPIARGAKPMSWEPIREGGWASTLTQGTKITPKVVELVVESVYPKFVTQFNAFLKSKNLPPVQGGGAVGSAYYYKRDLIHNPDKEYGDIDVHFFIPRIPNLTDSTNANTYATAVKEFADAHSDISTESGKNVVFKISIGYVQIDLVMAYYENKEWLGALTPEYNIKGVVSSTIYSSVAEVLNLSISTNGVQAKLRDGKPVSFRQSKNVELITVSTDSRKWALDIARFVLNTKGIVDAQISNDLMQNPGINPDDVKIVDIANAVKGIGHTLELNGVELYNNFIHSVLSIYTNKITAAMNSSKFDKAQDPVSAAKANTDKKKLQQGLDMVKGYFQ
jgi:hypothetical protein